MEINRDVRALISSSSTDLPKALSTYLADERVSGSVTDDHNDDVDAERCAALASKDALGEELQALVDALAELEARTAEQTDAAKKAVLLVQCRMAANNLKVGKDQSTLYQPHGLVDRHVPFCSVLNGRAFSQPQNLLKT